MKFGTVVRIILTCPSSQRLRWRWAPKSDDGKWLVTRAEGQNKGGYPIRVKSRPSFKSSTIDPLAILRERITSQGKAMPVPINWQGSPRAVSPSGRTQFFTRHE